MAHDTDPLARAKALAAEWEWQAELDKETTALLNRFKGITPSEVIRMWESGKNEHGRDLSSFEFGALVERWCEVFGELPPNEGGTEPVAATDGDAVADTEPEPSDDTMLAPKEVARQTGISLSTIKRMVEDGRFPQPLRLSPRRIGWLAQDVKAWIERLQHQRRSPRQ